MKPVADLVSNHTKTWFDFKDQVTYHIFIVVSDGTWTPINTCYYESRSLIINKIGQ